MAKRAPDTSANAQQTYMLKDLRLGEIYRDALSGYLVLVREAVIKEYAGGKDWSKTVDVIRVVGWYWNPVFGKHAEMELHDHQLISAEADTALLPDTRYKTGYHGRNGRS